MFSNHRFSLFFSMFSRYFQPISTFFHGFQGIDPGVPLRPMGAFSASSVHPCGGFRKIVKMDQNVVKKYPKSIKKVAKLINDNDKVPYNYNYHYHDNKVLYHYNKVLYSYDSDKVPYYSDNDNDNDKSLGALGPQAAEW